MNASIGFQANFKVGSEMAREFSVEDREVLGDLFLSRRQMTHVKGMEKAASFDEANAAARVEVPASPVLWVAGSLKDPSPHV